MTDSKKYLISQLDELGLTFHDIQPIRAEASTRSFYRVIIGKDSQASTVAMVYPEPAREEIDRIIGFTALYKKHGLKVPEIEERIGHRILLLEDLGNLLYQRYFSKGKIKGGFREHILDQVADIVIKLKNIPTDSTAATLSTSRMQWELDFFMTHFAAVYLEEAQSETGAAEFRERLHRLAISIKPIDTFAHRDFHSRNMLSFGTDIYLVDFQDSLLAPLYYDLVSFVYDAYLDIGIRRKYFLRRIEASGMKIDEEQFYLTALQRNIKALGTFGFQVNQRNHLSYKSYIPRTLGYVRNNPLYDRFFTPAQFSGEQ